MITRPVGPSDRRSLTRVAHMPYTCGENDDGERTETKVKEKKAYGGDLGTQRRRRAQKPAIRFGERGTRIDPKIPE